MGTELIQYQLVRYTGMVDGRPIEQTKVFAPTDAAYLELLTLQSAWIKEARAAREADKQYPSVPYEQPLFGQTTTKTNTDLGIGMPTPNQSRR